METEPQRETVKTEADASREFITPRLVEAGWSLAPHAIAEQRTFTNGRIIVTGGRVRRGKLKRADYLLYFRRDYPLAVVECWRRSKSDPPCRSNTDPRMDAGRMTAKRG